MERKEEASGSCPVPIEEYPNIQLAHGGGGRLMHRLLEKMFLPAFKNPPLDTRHDGATLRVGEVTLAFSTDSYVVHPLFFPGGDIGTLAVNGTVNDLAMCGARPLYLSGGFVIEEGFPTETLWRVVRSMQRSAEEAGVQIVTGDTKVVDRGKCDGVFVNTAGIGVVEHDLTIAPSEVRPGDVLLLNGDIGRHGIAVMAVREGLAFESTIESDCAPLSALVGNLLDQGIRAHCLRDLTRGGLASALVEVAGAGGVGIHVEEGAIPVRDDVLGACEILGFDPLYVANEGRFVAFVPPEDADKALGVMRAHPLGAGSSLIGEVTEGSPGQVSMTSRIGATRMVDLLSGEQLPRIC